MKVPFPQDNVEKFVTVMLLILITGTSVFLVKVVPSVHFGCDEFSPLTQRVHLQSKEVGEVEIAGEKCKLINVFSEGLAIEDKSRKCMLSYATHLKLASSTIVCPSGRSSLPIELAV